MKTILSTLAVLSLTVPAAFAHATLEQSEAAQGSTYKAVIRIGHGCGGEATTTLRVQIPEGVIAVKPMPKAGWDLETVTPGACQTAAPPKQGPRAPDMVWISRPPRTGAKGHMF